jgi:iron(III) transport system permease protein
MLPWVLFVVVAVVILGPVGIVLINGFNVSGSLQGFTFGFDNWTGAWSDPRIVGALWNTATIVLTRAVLGFVIAAPLAWLVARTDIPFPKGLEFGFWIAFFMPSLAYIQGWAFLLEGRRGILNQAIRSLPFFHGFSLDVYSYWGIIWVHLMSQNVSIIFILLVLGFRNMDSSLEEAARISGAPKWQTFLYVTLPLSRPMIAMIAMMAIIRGVQSYEVELVLGAPAGISVYSTLLVQMLNTEPPRLAEGAALSAVVLFTLVPLIVLQRLYVGRRHYATVSGKMRVGLVDLGKFRWPAYGIVAFVVLLQTLVPFLSVLAGSFMRRWGYFSISSPWTLERWVTVLNGDRFVSAFFNTVALGVASGIVAAVLCFVISYVLVRTQFALRGTLEFVSWLPWAIPGVLLSMGLVSIVLETPLLRVLYGSLAILIVAIVLFRFPLGVQLLKTGLMQINRELEEASTVCGSGPFYTQWRINVSILMPMFTTVALMTFVTAVNEVSGVVLLASTDVRTLSLVSLDYLVGISTQPETAAVVTTIMVLLCLGVTLIARWFGVSFGASQVGTDAEVG